MEPHWRETAVAIISNYRPVIEVCIRVLALLVLAALVWWIFNKVIGRLENKYRLRPFFEKNESFFSLLKQGGHYLILIFSGIGLIDLLHAAIIENAFYAFMILLLAHIVNGIIKSIIPYLRERVAVKTRTAIDDVVLGLMEKFSSVIVYGMGVVLALDKLGVNIVPFVAGAGIAGIAIGFAAKDTLSNLIAGILLIIDRPFELGDRIEVWMAPKNTASWGDVIDIGLRATKIRTTDNIVIVIPNNEIMRRDIINYTAGSKEIRVRIPIGIAYDANVKKAKQAIINVALELDWVMKSPPPVVVVRNFGESSVDLQARVWIREPRRRMDTISHITDRVKEVFQQEGIEIPYPKRDIYIKEKVSF